MNLIAFNNCGQSFAKDVGTYKLTRDELAASVARCEEEVRREGNSNWDSFDAVCDRDDSKDYDMHVFWHFAKIQYHVLQFVNHPDAYFYTASDDTTLLYIGPDVHYATVVGSIMSVQNEKGHLPETLD